MKIENSVIKRFGITAYFFDFFGKNIRGLKLS